MIKLGLGIAGKEVEFRQIKVGDRYDCWHKISFSAQSVSSFKQIRLLTYGRFPESTSS